MKDAAVLLQAIAQIFGTLSWPVIILVVMLIFRRNIGALIDRIKTLDVDPASGHIRAETEALHDTVNAAEEQPELTQAAGTIEGRIDHRGAGQIRLVGHAAFNWN